MSMFTQKFIKIFHLVEEIGPFSLFQNLALGKASTDDKCHFAIPWARSCQYQCVCKILSKYSKWFGLNFTVFRIWTSAKPRPIPNVIWLSHGLRHVNINVYAKFHHNIPLSSRQGHFHFFRIWSSAKPRPMKNVISQSLGLDLFDIDVYAKVYQNIHSVQEIGLFSLFQNLNLGHASVNP